MTEWPSNDDEADEVLRAYRRAVESDDSRPSPAVRTAIRARAENTARPQSTAWKWKVAASIGVVGLVGMLTSQIFRDRLDRIREPASVGMAPVGSDAATPEGPPSPAMPLPATTPPAALFRAEPPKLARNAPQAAAPSIVASTPRQASAAPAVPPPTPAAAPTASVPAPMDQKADAGIGARRSSAAVPEAKAATQAPALDATGTTNSLSQSAERDPWHDRTLQALRSNYPELFDPSSGGGSKRIAIAFNPDGSVYRSAIDTSTATPFFRLFESLRVNGADLESPPRVLLFASSSDHPDDLYVMVGIRK